MYNFDSVVKVRLTSYGEKLLKDAGLDPELFTIDGWYHHTLKFLFFVFGAEINYNKCDYSEITESPFSDLNRFLDNSQLLILQFYLKNAKIKKLNSIKTIT